MSNNEEVLSKIDAVIYLSYTNNSKQVALFCNQFLNYKLLEIPKIDLNIKYNNVLLVYPIHSQDIPKNLYNFLTKINCNKMIAIATYGRIKHGNSLYDLRYKFFLPLIGACYFQTRHSYLKNDDFKPNYDCLIPLLSKFNTENKKLIDIKKSKSTIGYNFFPKSRAKLSIKIILDKSKCTSCNLCTENCLNKAIRNGKINHNCIRCLSCVYKCPEKALDFKLTKVLKAYLKNQTSNQNESY